MLRMLDGSILSKTGSLGGMIVRLSLSVSTEKLRLFCFPYAGGAAHIFRGWSDYVPADVGLYSIQPPGRGTRFSEPPLRTLDALVSAVLADLVKLVDLPFILFGHSLGGRVAFAI